MKDSESEYTQLTPLPIYSHTHTLLALSYLSIVALRMLSNLPIILPGLFTV